jgi:hypothetical protein
MLCGEIMLGHVPHTAQGGLISKLKSLSIFLDVPQEKTGRKRDNQCPLQKWRAWRGASFTRCCFQRRYQSSSEVVSSWVGSKRIVNYVLLGWTRICQQKNLPIGIPRGKSVSQPLIQPRLYDRNCGAHRIPCIRSREQRFECSCKRRRRMPHGLQIDRSLLEPCMG